jgi:hypothetical protein
MFPRPRIKAALRIVVSDTADALSEEESGRHEDVATKRRERSAGGASWLLAIPVVVFAAMLALA